jgi:aminopeptidase N
MRKSIGIISVIISVLVFINSSLAQIDIYDTGGPLMPEQAAYDVRFYDLDLAVSPSDSSIKGSVQINADFVHPVDYFVLDLDTLLTISKIEEITASNSRINRDFNREIGKVWIDLKRTRQSGEKIILQVFYHGKPRVAVMAPWDGGFTWATTKDGSPWIATTCQGEGSDIWWPSKEHVSDEPDSMGIHVRVPDPLVCASNGKLLSVEKHKDNTSTYHWFVSTTINNYNVALNIAPYKVIEQAYTSSSGDNFPVKFWVLPEDYEKGQKIFPQFIEHLQFFEEMFGPYPFRADKYGVAQTPHLGMEHQTIIAYGANFNNAAMTRKDWGFDALHHHELSHEWWGNLVTNTDWKDMWIHEGFGTYTQALYMEKLKGMDGYHAFMDHNRNFGEKYAVAPRKSQTASEISKSPKYTKGAWTLHTLRYLIGDEALKKSLRRMAYPDPEMEKVTDGSHTRFVTTNDFKRIAEQISGMELGWFFDIYLHQPLLPELNAEIKDGKLTLNWKVPGSLPFPMPINIKMGDQVKRVQIPKEGVSLNLKSGIVPKIDPKNWVLFNPAGIKEAAAAIKNGNLKEARSFYNKVRIVDPQNKAALKMLKYLDYASINSNKITSDFFDKFVGKYKDSRRTVEILQEANKLFLSSRGIKYQLFPISNSEFTILDFNVTYSLVLDPNGIAKELVTKMGEASRKAIRVE